MVHLPIGARFYANRRYKAAGSAYVEDVIAIIPGLDYDVEVAEAHAELLVEVRSQGKHRGAHDLIIPATARVFDRTIVSADDTAFRAARFPTSGFGPKTRRHPPFGLPAGSKKLISPATAPRETRSTVFGPVSGTRT